MNAEGSTSCSTTADSTRSSSRSSTASGGSRHIWAKRRLKLVIEPCWSTTRMPSAVDSSVAASNEFAERSRCSLRTRSDTSWPAAMMPPTVGSSSRFVKVIAYGTATPPALRSRRSTVTGRLWG